MIDVIVGDQYPVSVINLSGLQRNGRQSRKVRCIELLNRVGKIRVNVDRAAGEPEAAAGLPQQAHRYAWGRLVRAHCRKISLRSEEHTSELQSLMRISYAVFCLKKKKK